MSGIIEIRRRDFLKATAGLMASLVAAPVRVFVPPREPFVYIAPGLNGLCSHLGILPSTSELNICEGKLLEIGDWDGTGYPCLVENWCTFGPGERARAWIHDFDLWNFRHDDDLGLMHRHPEGRQFSSRNAWHAYRRFGQDWRQIAKAGGGWLARQ